MEGADAVAGREATRGSAVRLLAEAGSRALTFVTSLLLARSLGVEGFAEFGFLAAIAVVVAESFDLGLHGTAQRALVSGELSLSSMVRAKLWLLLAGVAVALAVVPVSPVLALLLLFFGGSGWVEFAGVALRCRGRRAQEAAVLWLVRGSTLAAVAIAFARGGGLFEMAVAHAASPILAIPVALLLVRQAGPGGPAAADADRPPRDVLRVAWPLAVNGGLALLNVRAELIVLGLVLGKAHPAVGLFNAALRLVEVLNAVPNAIAAGAMPALTREAVGGGDAVRRRTALFAAALAVPSAVGLLLTAPGLMALLWGAEFAAGGPAAAVFAIALVPLFMGHVRLHALIAAGHARELPRLTAARLVVAATLAAGLGPALGAAGAALGFLISELLLLALAGRRTQAAGFPVTIARPVATAAAATVPMALCVAPLAGGDVRVAVAVGVVAFALTVALGGRRLRALGEGARP
jgi:O-antigen/teichoic acid export membrane protein